jgi:site-specific recombinase XerD
MMDNYWKLKIQLPNGDNQEMVNEFLLSLKLANRSINTIKTYRYLLENFFGEQKKPYSTLSSEDIHQWLFKELEYIKERTFRSRLTILTSFYNFCINEGYMEQSPIKRRWFPRTAKPIPKYLEDNEIAKIHQQVEKSSLRDRTLIEFMLTTGCRVAEINQLNREDVDIENRTAKVIGKGNKIRNVHFTEKCAVLLEKYIGLTEGNYQAVFVTETGNRLTIIAIQKVLQKLGKKAGLVGPLHPHRFRHTFATRLLKKGADLSFIGDELGHANVATTQIYARLPNQQIIALYRKFMG